MTEKTRLEIFESQKSDFVKKLKKVAKSKGYEIRYVYVEQCGYGDYLKLHISPIDNGFRVYTPSIYESTNFDNFENNPKFEIQTTSYGALNEEEMQKFMNAMNNGWFMIQYLNNLDWSKCPRINRVED